MLTRGDLLRYRIAFALSRASKIIRGLKAGLTEAERYAVADHVVTQLKSAAILGTYRKRLSPRRRRRL